MICILALIIFSILAIFSVSYRPLAAEAFDCVFRKATFRKCRTNLDQRLKSQITGRLLTKSPFLARFIYKRFELISWIFVILLISSLLYSGYGVYNYARYGHCDGVNAQGFCVYDAFDGDEPVNAPCVEQDSKETLFTPVEKKSS
ncbi:hypothetical protein KY338_00125 [Candidatus Woesearchaeota archaeon]|nr:hypothetical protein [Candidatus Woesearchaeota archaeon]MBW3005272.1 hypothetical protein [Candidatus Woesearchaeota archaeon]